MENRRMLSIISVILLGGVPGLLSMMSYEDLSHCCALMAVRESIGEHNSRLCYYLQKKGCKLLPKFHFDFQRPENSGIHIEVSSNDNQLTNLQFLALRKLLADSQQFKSEIDSQEQQDENEQSNLRTKKQIVAEWIVEELLTSLGSPKRMETAERGVLKKGFYIKEDNIPLFVKRAVMLVEGLPHLQLESFLNDKLLKFLAVTYQKKYYVQTPLNNVRVNGLYALDDKGCFIPNCLGSIKEENEETDEELEWQDLSSVVSRWINWELVQSYKRKQDPGEKEEEGMNISLPQEDYCSNLPCYISIVWLLLAGGAIGLIVGVT